MARLNLSHREKKMVNTPLHPGQKKTHGKTFSLRCIYRSIITKIDLGAKSINKIFIDFSWLSTSDMGTLCFAYLPTVILHHLSGRFLRESNLHDGTRLDGISRPKKLPRNSLCVVDFTAHVVYAKSIKFNRNESKMAMERTWRISNSHWSVVFFICVRSGILSRPTRRIRSRKKNKTGRKNIRRINITFQMHSKWTCIYFEWIFALLLCSHDLSAHATLHDIFLTLEIARDVTQLRFGFIYRTAKQQLCTSHFHSCSHMRLLFYAPLQLSRCVRGTRSHEFIFVFAIISLT